MNSRQGILSRPIKQGNPRNEGSIEKAHRQQQEMQRAKSAKFNKIMDHRVAFTYGGPEVKKSFKKEFANEICLHQEVRKVLRKSEKEEHLKQDRVNDAIQNRFYQAYEGRRSMTKLNEKQAMFDNMKMAEQRKSQKTLARIQDLEIDHKHLKIGPYAMSFNGR